MAEYSFTSHPSGAKVIRARGYLFKNPTNLGTEAGWGTKLGYLKKGIIIVWNQHIETYSGVVNGQEPTLSVYCGGAVMASFSLRSYDANIIDTALPGRYSTGIRLPGTIAAGTSMAAYRNVLLFVPCDRERHPAVLMRSAVIEIKEQTKLSIQNEVEFLCHAKAFRASDDADGIFFMGPITNVTL